MPRKYNRGALIAGAVMKGLGDFAKSAGDMRAEAAKRELEKQKSGRTSAQYDYEYMQKLPQEQKESFGQIARPAPYGYSPIDGGGIRPNPTPIIGPQPSVEYTEGKAAFERYNAATQSGQIPDPVDTAMATRTGFIKPKGRR